MPLKKLLQNRFVLLLLAIVFFVTGFFLSFSDDVNYTELTKEFETVLHRKEKHLQREVDSLAAISEDTPLDSIFEQYTPFRGRLFEEEGIVLLIYHNDTLKFWSNNSAAVENQMNEVCLDDRLAHLKNGWFEVYKRPSKPLGTQNVVGLLLLQREYSYQNKYLHNTFEKEFSLPPGTSIIRGDENNVNKVYSSLPGDPAPFLCTLVFPPSASSENSPFGWGLAVLYLLGIICAIAYLQLECAELSFRIGKYWSALLFLLLLLILRWLTIYFRFPGPVYSLPLFSPEFYGDADSFWLPSLGDLFVNSLLISYATFYLYVFFPARKLVFTRDIKKLTIAFTLILFAYFLLSRWLNHIFIGLIENSVIPYNINNLFQLNVYSYIALAIPGLLLFSFYFLGDKLISVMLTSGMHVKRMLLPFGIALTCYVLYSHWKGTLDEIMFLWPAVLLLMIVYSRHKLGAGLSFSGVALVILIFSVYSAHMFIRHSRLKENKNRSSYAEKLALEQDPLAENFFNELSSRIRSDTTLFYTLINRESFGRTLMERYFAGYWDRYDIRISVFDTACIPIVDGSVPNRDNHSYFEEQISQHSFPTACPDLYYLDNPQGKISYLAKIPLLFGREQKVRVADIYIELDSRFISEEIGFPELLLEKEIGLTQKLADYSYAKYKNGQLINYFGKYPFSYYLDVPGLKEGEKTYTDEGEYQHLYYKSDPSTLIVLSLKPVGLMGFVTTFSYLFTYYSLILLVLLLLRQSILGYNFEQLSFKYRIQLLLVFTVLVSLVLFGAGTIYYIQKQYNDQNTETISEKTQSVVIEVENKIADQQTLTSNYSEYATYILKKFSNVFFTDITLYDLKGNMYASSRPKIFEEGLASRKMNPEAYLELAFHHRNLFIHEENIGELKYLSAYVPFRNKDGKLLAYLNLPYFARQSELEKEISTFLAALINIYVLLFVFSVVTALMMSNYMTKPLRIIQAKLGNIRLGKRNEPIVWKQKDEIGSLVSEYNRMIEELQQSAELLARSERESAWREMAKQVAHEIKNPLTPMKLSIQHLQRLLNDTSPDVKHKIQRLSQTIIEQIEALSNIASEFSNFAKMPRPNHEKTDLVGVLRNTISLFRNSTDTEFHFMPEMSEAFVYADKDQLLRVFNNLIKNGMQAIPEDRKGRIDISIRKESGQFLVSVIDNGAGISDEALNKIFVPNFTTKTGGMGLGLAMVKNIVEGMDGRIWFQTGAGKGTTFYVALNEYEER